MRTSLAIILSLVCIAVILLAGCTQPSAGPLPAATSSGSGPSGTDSPAAGTARTLSCTIGPSMDPSKTGVLEITSARAEVVTKNVFIISGNIRNLAGEGTYSSVAARLCNSRTGNCVKDMVGVILKPSETVEYSLVPNGGCPDTVSDTSSCQCEVWIDILR